MPLGLIAAECKVDGTWYSYDHPKCSAEKDAGGSNPTDKKWHNGGTLHKADGREWRDAESRNQLATSADFVTALLKDQLDSMDEVRSHAIELQACITEATRDDYSDNEAVATIAASCATLMGWK